MGLAGRQRKGIDVRKLDANGHGQSNYLRAWSSVLRSSKTSTLKFAVARAILDEVREAVGEGEVLILRQQLALRLVFYYWHQVRQFRLKQAPAEIQEPNVARRLRALPEELGTKWDPLRSDVKAVVSFVAEEGFREVIPRFHTGLEHRIFELRSGGVIAVTTHQRAFIQAFEPILMRSVLGGWAGNVEQYNLTPRVLAKIRFDGRRRTSVTKWAKPLREIDDTCFYCRKASPLSAHVDHVIPWSFLFDDPAWNLVLACDTCNVNKRDRIPAPQFMRRLCERNDDLASVGTGGFSKRVSFSLTQLPLGGSKGLAKSLEVLCEQAFLQGFAGNWTPS